MIDADNAYKLMSVNNVHPGQLMVLPPDTIKMMVYCLIVSVRILDRHVWISWLHDKKIIEEISFYHNESVKIYGHSLKEKM